MAGLNPFSGSVDERNDRGQLVVITGLVIAVALVGLVLVVNTAIYTENLATRDPDVGDEEAIEYADSVRTGVGGIVDRENEREHGEYDHATENVTAGVEILDATLGRTYVERAIDADVNESSITYREGRLVRQTNEGRTFESSNGLDDWDVAYDVNQTRAFEATIDDSTLVSTTDDDLGNAFHVTVAGNETDEEWRAYVYENSSTNEIAVAVENESEIEPIERCSVDADAGTVDFTAGTLDGEPCPGFEWTDGVTGSYDIAFANGDNATGTYDATVDISDGSGLNESELADDPDDESPYHVPAVYGADVEITYRSSDLLFRTELRIVPGEPDE